MRLIFAVIAGATAVLLICTVFFGAPVSRGEAITLQVSLLSAAIWEWFLEQALRMCMQRLLRAGQMADMFMRRAMRAEQMLHARPDD